MRISPHQLAASSNPFCIGAPPPENVKTTDRLPAASPLPVRYAIYLCIHREGIHREGIHREGILREGIHREGIHREGIECVPHREYPLYPACVRATSYVICIRCVHASQGGVPS